MFRGHDSALERQYGGKESFCDVRNRELYPETMEATKQTISQQLNI